MIHKEISLHLYNSVGWASLYEQEEKSKSKAFSLNIKIHGVSARLPIIYFI